MANGRTGGSYYGYQAPQGNVPDYAGAFSSARKSVTDALDRKKAVRQKADKEYQDSKNALSEVQNGKDKEFNDLIGDGLNNTRDALFEKQKLLYAGKIKPYDWTSYNNNLKNSMTALSEVSTNYNEVFASFLERQQVDPETGRAPAGIQEDFAAAELGEFADFSHRKLMADPSGNFFFAYENKDGTIDPDKSVNVNYVNRLQNHQTNAVDLPSAVASYTEQFGDFKKVIDDEDIQTTEGLNALEGAGFLNEALENLYGMYMNSPSKLMSVLGDNSVYSVSGTAGDQAYFTYKTTDLVDPKDPSKGFKDTSKHDGKPMNQGILMELNPSGDWEPKLNEDQVKQAKKVIRQQFYLSMGVKETAKPQYSSDSNNLSVAQQTELKKAKNLYNNAMSIATGQVAQLNGVEYNNGRIEGARPHKGGIQFYVVQRDGSKQPVVIKRPRNAQGENLTENELATKFARKVIAPILQNTDPTTVDTRFMSGSKNYSQKYKTDKYLRYDTDPWDLESYGPYIDLDTRVGKITPQAQGTKDKQSAGTTIYRIIPQTSWKGAVKTLSQGNPNNKSDQSGYAWNNIHKTQAFLMEDIQSLTEKAMGDFMGQKIAKSDVVVTPQGKDSAVVSITVVNESDPLLPPKKVEYVFKKGTDETVYNENLQALNKAGREVYKLYYGK